MSARIYQFGPFRLDLAQRELRRNGVRLRLAASRIRLLDLLISRRGELIAREEIAAHLWEDATTVDVMSGINTAVNQLRTQLGDDSVSPKYIETVIGAGYRFIAPVVEVRREEQIEISEAPFSTMELPVEKPHHSDNPRCQAPGTERGWLI